MASVELRQLRKTYPGVPQVIHGLDLLIQGGEFMVFVGPSGCGKSTTLRMIAGLEDITDGDLLIGGQRVNDVPAAKRGVAMVFQSYALYPHMTIAENLGFSLKLAGMPRDRIREAVEKVARTLQLEALLQRKPKALSGGQRQRVAIGRAIVRQPDVFLFDEPLSNLDASLRVQMRVEIARLHRELGNTTIYVTHDQVEAMTLGTRIAVFNGGVIEQCGTPIELYEYPVNRFVAGFIGSPSMNFIPAHLLGLDTRFSVGIRPEHIRLVPVGTGIQAKVDLVEHLGGEQIVHAVLAQSDTRLMVRLSNPDTSLVTGMPIGLDWEPQRQHLFNEQGQTIPQS